MMVPLCTERALAGYMKLLSTIKAERCISQFLSETDVNSPAARKAAEAMKRAGPAAIPKLIDALPTADKEQTSVIVDALSAQVSDKTLREYTEGLTHNDQRSINGVAWALSSTDRFNANALLDLLADDRISKPAVIDDIWGLRIDCSTF